MTAAHSPLHFSVALDLRRRSDGALAFAQWLKRTVGEAGRTEIRVTGLHVIETEQIAHLRDVRGNDGMVGDDMVDHANRGIKDLVERLGAQNTFVADHAASCGHPSR